jgi:glutaredoxin
MVLRIEVYIKSDEVVVSSGMIGQPVSDGVTTHYCTIKETSKRERVMPEADRLALEIVNKLASERGLAVEVCDISTFKGRMKARLKNVRVTPTILIGERRVETEDDLRQLESKLESYLRTYVS